MTSRGSAPEGSQRLGVPADQQPPAPPPTAGAKLEIIEGSSAGYRVTEQLVGIDFPNDAIGGTGKVSGWLQIMSDGSRAPASNLVVHLKGMTSV